MILLNCKSVGPVNSNKPVYPGDVCKPVRLADIRRPFSRLLKGM